MISKTGIWSAEEAQRSGYPKNVSLPGKLCTILSQFEKVIDFGCGDGYYIRSLYAKGFKCYGLDGYLPENTWDLSTVKQDLSKPFSFLTGQVISFEVGEHIPKLYESVFIDNLVKHCTSRMVISWAIEGQGGIGHVNCRSNDYIIDKITRKGFIHNIHLTEWIRLDTPMEVKYFENTLMVFDRLTI